MAQCKWCGKKGFLLSVDQHGLCSSCSPSVVLDIKERLRVIGSSREVANNAKNWRTKASRIDLMVRHLEHLQQYEQRGILSLDPPGPQALQDLERARRDAAIEAAETEVSKALASAETATTPKTKVNRASKALLALDAIRREIADYEELVPHEQQIRRFMHEANLNGFLDAARKAEFKGNKKKALDQYQEALFFLLNDDVDDSLQSEHIKSLEAKICQLTEAST